ncbi:MAG: electron transfer flavoprotein subunit beta/FixA family protein [Chloroflexota bacterium]
MSCDIVVCVKQVPHPDYFGKISLDPSTGTIRREGLPAVINPVDRNALEEALRIRERSGGKVMALTMGPPQAKKALEEALALELDGAIHLCDRAFAGADTLATAQALAHAIRKLEHVDLVLCGNNTIDSGTGQVAVQIAQLLDLPCVPDAEELTFENERTLLVKRVWERGYVRVRVRLPAMIAVNSKINQPRLPNIFGIMAIAQKEIKTWDAAEIGADVTCLGLSGSPTQFFQISEFSSNRRREILQGNTDEVVSQAVDKLLKLEML